MFVGKTLLITGGTGSFGHAVARRFLGGDIGELRIFSRDEKKQDDMRRLLGSGKAKFYIGDVRSRDSVDRAMDGVDCVFHAAALKQVPSCEFFPMEAVRTNVVGTENVLLSAIQHGVEKVVALSTDKAAYPVNAMGISKAMMEKVAVAASRNAGRTTVCCTRYGNVLASRGSVVPLFIEQVKTGRPLTVTNPRMTRFLMTLESAVELVLFAFENGRAGDIYVQKSPSCHIGDLAQAVKDLLGADNVIKTIGTRHGEKLYETLLTKEEFAKAEDLGAYYRIPADSRDLNYAQYFTEGQQVDEREYNSNNTEILGLEKVKEMLAGLDAIKEALPKGAAS
jgi:UDP-glucose 4-epimerase